MKTKPIVGIVVAIEMDALLAQYGSPAELREYPGYVVRRYDKEWFTVYAVDSGPGEIAAAAATQFLISMFQTDLIVNFGVVGALTQEMATSDLCVVKDVVHYDFDAAGWMDLQKAQYPGYESIFIPATPSLVRAAIEASSGIKTVVCASADKFVDSPLDKQKLHDAYGADICEMESAGIALTCRRNNIPFLLLKAVSDSLTGGSREFSVELDRVSRICFSMVDRIIHDIALNVREF